MSLTLLDWPRARRALLAMGALLLLAYTWMFSAISVPNERSRVYLGVAMVDHQTLAIDAPIARFGRIYDRARHDGKTYTDKAPGSSFLAAIPYWLVRRVTAPEDWTIAELVNLMRTWVMLPIALVGFLVMRRVLYLSGVDEDLAELGAAGWLLGTAAFHYSGAFYGHQIVAVALLVGLWLLLDLEQGADGGAWRCAGAGAAAGLAGLTEYQAGVPCVLLALYLLAGPARSPRHVVAFGLGALPFLGALLLYNTYAFGGPLELSYHHLVARDLASLHREGVGGVSAPRPELVMPVLFSPHRGLITTSPIFALWLPGIWALWKGERRRLAALSGLSGLFYVLLLVSTRAWFGGWSFGPRLLVPGMAWMMIGAMALTQRYRDRMSVEALTRGLIAWGFVYHQLVHVVLPELPPSRTNPLVDVVLPALRRGLVAPNLGAKLTGQLGLTSLWPLALVVCSGSSGSASPPHAGSPPSRTPPRAPTPPSSPAAPPPPGSPASSPWS